MKLKNISTASALLDFAEHIDGTIESNISTNDDMERQQQMNLFWSCLAEKLRKGTIGVDSSSFIKRILNWKKTPPPYFITARLVEMSSVDDIQSIVQKYPSTLHQTFTKDECLILHMMAWRGGWKLKDAFEYILFKGIEEEVGGVDGYGGFVVKDKRGQTPLRILFAMVVSKKREHWEWFCCIMKRCVEERWKIRMRKNDYLKQNEITVPLLHAALELSAPPGLINRILSSTTEDSLSKRDFLGRTPLLIATSKVTTNSCSDDVILKLLRHYPAASRQKDIHGNIPLNLKIQAGPNRHKRYQENENDPMDTDLFLIGSMVQASPESMQIQDVESKLPPFMLASVGDKWSLNVVYGLLRTSPWVIESLSSIRE